MPPFVLTPPETLRGSTGPAAAALTGRQSEILGLIGADVSNKEIARRLSISEKTVKAHIGAIFRALRVTSRVQAAIAVRARASSFGTAEDA